MKTNPFATTQWEYGPRGFGCFGRSGTARTSFASGNVPTTKRIVSGDMSSSGFYRCKSILNSDGVDGGEPETHFGPRGGIPDGQERPCLSHWRRRWRRRLVDRGELREDQRAERNAYLDVFVVSECDPRRPCVDPNSRRPRSGPVSRGGPGRCRVPEPADDGCPPGASHRGRRDCLRYRRHEAGSEESPRERAPLGDSPPQESTKPLPERVQADGCAQGDRVPHQRVRGEALCFLAEGNPQEAHVLADFLRIRLRAGHIVGNRAALA